MASNRELSGDVEAELGHQAGAGHHLHDAGLVEIELQSVGHGTGS